MMIINVILMTLLGSIAASCLKKTEIDKNNLLKFIFQPVFICGIGLYGISALLNLFLLKKYEYTTIFPLTTLTYIWTIFLGAILFKEKIGVKKILAILCIIIGAVCIVQF